MFLKSYQNAGSYPCSTHALTAPLGIFYQACHYCTSQKAQMHMLADGFLPNSLHRVSWHYRNKPEERKLPRRCSLVCPHQTAWHFQARFLPSSSGGSLGARITACIVRGRGLWNARQQREGDGPHLARAFVSWVIKYSHHLLTFPGRCKLVSVPLNSLLASS